MTTFAEDLLKIGNGSTIRKSSTTKEDVAPWKHGHIPDNALDDLIDQVYPNLYRPGITKREYLSERAILAIANKDVARINSKLMARIPSELTTYWSVDRAISEEDEAGISFLRNTSMLSTRPRSRPISSISNRGF